MRNLISLGKPTFDKPQGLLLLNNLMHKKMKFFFLNPLNFYLLKVKNKKNLHGDRVKNESVKKPRGGGRQTPPVCFWLKGSV